MKCRTLLAMGACLGGLWLDDTVRAAEPIPEEIITEPAAGNDGAPQASAPPAPAGDFSRAVLTTVGDVVSDFLAPGLPRTTRKPERFQLSVRPSVGYDNNVFTTQTDQVRSGTASLNAVGAYNFGDERLKLSSLISGGVTTYDNRPGDSTDLSGGISGTASYFVTRRLQVAAQAGITYLAQPSPTVIGGTPRYTGDYIVGDAGFDIFYSLRPRLSVRLGYDINGIKYTDEAQNQSLGYTQQTVTLGLNYLLTPRFTLLTEYRYTPLSYYETGQDSVGQILSVGFLSSFTPKLTWNFQLGAESRQLNSTAPGATSEYIGPFLETRFSYQLPRDGLLDFSVRYGTEPSGVAGISISETLRAALTLRYQLATRLTGNLEIAYQHSRYDQPGDSEDYSQAFYSLTAGLTYRLNAAVGVNLQATYFAVDSELQASDYNRTITSLGLEFLF